MVHDRSSLVESFDRLNPFPCGEERKRRDREEKDDDRREEKEWRKEKDRREEKEWRKEKDEDEDEAEHTSQHYEIPEASANLSLNCPFGGRNNN